MGRLRPRTAETTSNPVRTSIGAADKPLPVAAEIVKVRAAGPASSSAMVTSTAACRPTVTSATKHIAATTRATSADGMGEGRAAVKLSRKNHQGSKGDTL